MTHSSGMPKIDLIALKAVLTASELALVTRIVADRGENKGCLRASKPTIKYQILPKNTPENPARWDVRSPIDGTGESAYIWRMVAFQVSPVPQHSCMPVMAECDLPGTYESRRQLSKDLDVIVDKVVNTIPKYQWAGIIRWGRALGQID